VRSDLLGFLGVDILLEDIAVVVVIGDILLEDIAVVVVIGCCC